MLLVRDEDIDLFIAEENYLGKRYGTKIIIEFVKLLFEKYHAEKIMIHPEADNTKAITCYEKADFQFLKL